MDLINTKILICDDSELFRTQIKDCIQSFGQSQIFEAYDGENSVKIYKKVRPDIVFMDIVMPNKDGIQALIEIIEYDKNAKVIMISSMGTQNYIKTALEEGAMNFLQKPIEHSKVEKTIRSVL